METLQRFLGGQRVPGWTALAAMVAALLLPNGAQALGVAGPIAADTHWMLEQPQYLVLDPGDGGTLGGTADASPGTSAPTGAMVQSLVGNNFIKLQVNTDYTVDNGNDGDRGIVTDSTGAPLNTASLANGLPFETTWRIGWNGTIHGDSPADYFDEYGCGEGNGETYYEGCELMHDGEGNVRILFVVWGARWNVDGGTGLYRDNPTLLGGFDDDTVVVDALSDSDVTDPMLITDQKDGPDGVFLAGLIEWDSGMGVKFHLNPDGSEHAMFTMDWFLGEDPVAEHGDPDPDIAYQFAVSAYVYTIPEPATGLLLLSGLVGLALAGRRQHQA